MPDWTDGIKPQMHMHLEAHACGIRAISATIQAGATGVPREDVAIKPHGQEVAAIIVVGSPV